MPSTKPLRDGSPSLPGHSCSRQTWPLLLWEHGFQIWNVIFPLVTGDSQFTIPLQNPCGSGPRANICNSSSAKLEVMFYTSFLSGQISEILSKWTNKWMNKLAAFFSILHMNVYSSFSYNNQKIEATPMSINWWMAKHYMVHPYSGALFIYAKKWSPEACYKVDKPQEHHSKLKKSEPKGHILFDSFDLIYPD